MEWKEIRRDRFGFADESCLDEIYHFLPVIVKQKGRLITDLACEDNWDEMRGKIDRYAYYTHYCPIPKLPIEEEEEEWQQQCN